MANKIEVLFLLLLLNMFIFTVRLIFVLSEISDFLLLGWFSFYRKYQTFCY